MADVMGPNWPTFLYPVFDVMVRAGRLVVGHPVQRREGYRPFFIVGSGRSGNTLMRRMLQSHSAVHIPPETYVLGRVIRLYFRNRQLAWKDLVALVYGPFALHPEFSKFDLSLGPLVERMATIPPRDRSLAYLLNGFYAYHAEQAGCTMGRWGDKTPYNTFSLPWILRVFPDARFLHMVRDGADVVVSYVKAGLQPDLTAAAGRWLRSVDAVRRFARRRPDCVMEIRYEDLVQDPGPVLSRACAFLDLDYEESMVSRLDHVDSMGDLSRFAHLSNAGRPVTTESIGRGRQALSAEDRRLLGLLMNEELVRMGYAPLS